MNKRKVLELRKALAFGVQSSMPPEERKRFRLAKRLYDKLPRQERAGYIQGLGRVTREMAEVKAAIAKEKELRAEEDKTA